MKGVKRNPDRQDDVQRAEVLNPEQLGKRCDKKVEIFKEAENAKRDRHADEHEGLCALALGCAFYLLGEDIADVGLQDQQQQKANVPVTIE